MEWLTQVEDLLYKSSLAAPYALKTFTYREEKQRKYREKYTQPVSRNCAFKRAARAVTSPLRRHQAERPTGADLA